MSPRSRPVHRARVDPLLFAFTANLNVPETVDLRALAPLAEGVNVTVTRTGSGLPERTRARSLPRNDSTIETVAGLAALPRAELT